MGLVVVFAVCLFVGMSVCQCFAVSGLLLFLCRAEKRLNF